MRNLVIYILCALMQVPFIVTGKELYLWGFFGVNTFAFGFCIGLLIAGIITEFL